MSNSRETFGSWVFNNLRTDSKDFHRARKLALSAFDAGRTSALEDVLTLCREYEEITSVEKDSALLVGKVDLSNAMSGEPRAARFLADKVAQLKEQQ